MTDTHTAYTDFDTLIRQLDAAGAMPAAAWFRAHSYQLLRLPPEATVVDVDHWISEQTRRAADDRLLIVDLSGSPPVYKAAALPFELRLHPWLAEHAPSRPQRKSLLTDGRAPPGRPQLRAARIRCRKMAGSTYQMS